MIRIIAGSHNSAKIAELASALRGVAQVAPPPNGISPSDDERGATVEEIAAGKAAAWSRALQDVEPGALVAATDGGLLVPALGDRWNPMLTRRFAGDAADDRARADALLALAADLDGDARRVGWREAVALARDGMVLDTFVGEGPTGLLARDYDPVLIGAGGGFWMPALWICPELGGKRLTELTEG